MYVEGMMRNKNYLLSIREFLEGENSGMLLKEAFCKVDVKRRSKAERMRTDRGKAACLGAGLLLQLAVREAVGACGDAGRRDMGEEIHSEDVLRRFSVSWLLESISYSIPISYYYGKNGKPYFQEYPFYFNLSHSGDYVFCALSSGEVGADIQQYCSNDNKRLAERFFSPQEILALQGCGEGKNALFYRLWARKEAYGKLTGEGIAPVIGMNFLPEAAQRAGGRKLVWEEYSEPEGYHLAICRYDAHSLE